MAYISKQDEKARQAVITAMHIQMEMNIQMAMITQPKYHKTECTIC